MARLRRAPRPALPRFAVAWFPSFRGIERIEAFRREHDPAADLIAAHVSLVFPFATALTQLQIETHVRRVVSRWPPIPVSFRAIRMEANEFVFLMAARGAASIVELHDRLYTRSLAAHLRREFTYAPHITIARHREWPELEAAYGQACDRFGDELTDVIREAVLLSVGRTGKIIRLASFALHSA